MSRKRNAAPQKGDYIVKDLEPEDIHGQSGFKPFHVGGAMTMEVKAEAPKSQMFTPKSEDSEAFRTDTKNLEFDLEALLAETANELAQAVAEETESESKEEVQEEAAGTEEVSEETESEAEDTDAFQAGLEAVANAFAPEETVEEDVKETAQDTGLPAPAAARAAIVADNLRAALF